MNSALHAIYEPIPVGRSPWTLRLRAFSSLMYARKGSCLWQQVSLKRVSPRRRVTFANPLWGCASCCAHKSWVSFPGHPLASGAPRQAPGVCPSGQPLAVQTRSRRVCLCLSTQSNPKTNRPGADLDARSAPAGFAPGRVRISGPPDGALILCVAGWSRGRQKAPPYASVAARDPSRAPSGSSDSSPRCSGAPYGTI
jgi:hypothetical protein